MRASAFDPPELLHAFWQRTDVRSALSKRDMGALFYSSNSSYTSARYASARPLASARAASARSCAENAA